VRSRLSGLESLSRPAPLLTFQRCCEGRGALWAGLGTPGAAARGEWPRVLAMLGSGERTRLSEVRPRTPARRRRRTCPGGARWVGWLAEGREAATAAQGARCGVVCAHAVCCFCATSQPQGVQTPSTWPPDVRCAQVKRRDLPEGFWDERRKENNRRRSARHREVCRDGAQRLAKERRALRGAASCMSLNTCSTPRHPSLRRADAPWRPNSCPFSHLPAEPSGAAGGGGAGCFAAAIVCDSC